MSKPKIAFVLPALDMGGAQRVVTTLANALIDDYELYIITFINPKPFYKLDDNITLVNCVDSIQPSSNILEAIKNNYILFKKIHAIRKKYKINLLISFLTPANILTTLVAKYNGIPVIISERNNPYSEKAPKIWEIMRAITYPKANYVVVQTETIKSFYAKKIKQNRLEILPNPISAELTLQRNNTVQKENLILNAGRLSDQKAQDILIKAFARTENTHWKLVIAGEGPNRVKYDKLIKKLNLGDKVLLLGRQKDIHELYNSSKIFAFSSLYEGFPNALIEAMHFGLACVSTDCPTGPSELINDSINGYLIPMNDEKAMAEKLNVLMNDENKRKSFGDKAIKTVKKIEIKNVVVQWKALIENCIGL